MRVEIDKAALKRKMERGEREAVYAVSAQVLTDANFYCLRDVGTLMASALICSDLEAGRIEWATPYARRRYYEKSNVRLDHNPNARIQWADAAKEDFGEDWIRIGKKSFGKGCK